MSYRSVIAVGLLALSTVSGIAFENIEADVAYDRQIREMIQKEFAAGLEMLKKQAIDLKTEPRQKDFDRLREHMYEKALILGGCLDQAIAIKKRGQPVDVEKYSRDCTRVYLRFKDDYLRGVLAERPALSCSLDGKRTRSVAKPYDFLAKPGDVIDEAMLNALYYIPMKRCYDKDPMVNLFSPRK